MKRILYAISILSVLILLAMACATKDAQPTAAKELGIDVSGETQQSKTDSHGGFHGDGTAVTVLCFSDDTVLNQIEESADWAKFPLDDTVTALVYGVSDASSKVGPFLSDADGNPLIPKIQNGYYRLLDRQTEAENADLLQRSSFNFTLGIYDTDARLLYLCRLDT